MATREVQPIMSGSQFYVTGGTLPANATSYVERQADKDLLDGLRVGEYCYVLNTRQMGKSSLMVRTAARLRQEGFTVAILDLTAIGQNLTPEQWYDGLLVSLAEQLVLEDELESFWNANRHLGPLQRFLGAIQKSVLPQVGGRIVLFVDEIDAVRSLPFPADEFFAGIRALYNLRTEHPEMSRITFCLLGVATPADLIRETRMSPFNVGRRIQITDFTPEEAAPLAVGLANVGATLRGRPSHADGYKGAGGHPGRGDHAGSPLLARVLYWTGGNPYMTQRLCRALAETTHQSPLTTHSVDDLCRDLFFTKAAQESDDNLAFVRNRLLRSEADLASVLDLYQRVRAGKRVADDETNPLCGILKLSGVAKEEGGLLKVRNRIYQRVFDREWVRAHVPDAEVRRQKTAYRRAVIHTAVVSAAIFASIGILAVVAVRNARVAERERRDTRRNLYASDMNVAQQALSAGMPGRAIELLNAYRPKLGQEDLRTFEWRYLWRQCAGQSTFTYPNQGAMMGGLAFSPDGRLMATGDRDGTVKIWDVHSHRELTALHAHTDWAGDVRFSPDGARLLTGDRLLFRLWDLAARKAIKSYPTHWGERAFNYTFLPDGKPVAFQYRPAHQMVICDPDSLEPLQGGVFRNTDTLEISHDFHTIATADASIGVVRVWEVAVTSELVSIREVCSRRFPVGVEVKAVAQDGGTVLVAENGRRTYTLWDRTLGRALATVSMPNNRGFLAYAPDGKTVAIADNEGAIKLVKVRSGQAVVLRGHEAVVYHLAYSPDGITLASSGKDGAVKLWDIGTREELITLPGKHVCVSSDGSETAVGGSARYGGSGRLLLWRGLQEKPIHFAEAGALSTPITFSPDGHTLFGVTTASNTNSATTTDSFQVRWWDTRSGAIVGSLPRRFDHLVWFALSSDAKSLAVLTTVDGNAEIWDPHTGRWVRSLKGFGVRYQYPLQNLAFTPDGRSLTVGYGDRTVRVWYLANHEPPAILAHFGDVPGGICYSADGRWLAIGNWLGEIWVWDTANLRTPIARFKAHNEGPTALAFSPDRKTLATGGFDSKIRLWNVLTWRNTLTLEGHAGAITSLQFSPDGNRLYSASAGGPVRIWYAAAPTEADRAWRK